MQEGDPMGSPSFLHPAQAVRRRASVGAAAGRRAAAAALERARRRALGVETAEIADQLLEQAEFAAGGRRDPLRRLARTGIGQFAMRKVAHRSARIKAEGDDLLVDNVGIEEGEL